MTRPLLTPKTMRSLAKLSAADAAYVGSMAFACFLSYEAATLALSRVASRGDGYLGGMWATVATVFVFKDSRGGSVSAGLDRLLATIVSFAWCLLYLVLFPFTAVGLATVLGAGTATMIALGRRDDITTTGITSTVVMVVAATRSQHAWLQPVLRLLDTVIGVAVGVGVEVLRAFLMNRRVGMSRPGSRVLPVGITRRQPPGRQPQNVEPPC